MPVGGRSSTKVCLAALAVLAGCAGTEGRAPADGTPPASSERFEGSCFLLRVLGTEASPLCESNMELTGLGGGSVAATFGARGGLALSFVGSVVPESGPGDTTARIERLRVDPRGTGLPAATLDATGSCRYSDLFSSRFSIYCEATDSEGVVSSAFLVGRRTRRAGPRRACRPAAHRRRRGARAAACRGRSRPGIR